MRFVCVEVLKESRLNFRHGVLGTLAECMVGVAAAQAAPKIGRVFAAVTGYWVNGVASRCHGGRKGGMSGRRSGREVGMPDHCLLGGGVVRGGGLSGWVGRGDGGIGFGDGSVECMMGRLLTEGVLDEAV
jgi:hypothetical protein